MNANADISDNRKATEQKRVLRQVLKTSVEEEGLTKSSKLFHKTGTGQK